jgi:hypothetical protein
VSRIAACANGVELTKGSAVAVGARRHDCPRRSATMAARTACNGASGCRQGPQIRTLPIQRLLRQIDQHIVDFAIRCFAGREVEGDGPALGITETVNFTGEPAARAAKSSLMNLPFPPAAETWARTVVLSLRQWCVV